MTKAKLVSFIGLITVVVSFQPFFANPALAAPVQDQVAPQVTTVHQELLKQPVDPSTLQGALAHLVEVDPEKFTLRLIDQQHLLEQSLFKHALLLLETLRQDKEQASGLLSGGNTSLVAKAAAPAVLGLALESGALSNQLSGNTSTVRGNLYSTTRLFSPSSLLSYCSPVDPRCNTAVNTFLHSLSYSVSLNAPTTSTSSNSATVTPVTSAGTPTPAISAAGILSSGTKLSGWTIRYTFYNPDDPFSASFRTRFADKVSNTTALHDAAVSLAKSFDAVYKPLTTSTFYSQWLQTTVARLQTSLTANSTLAEIEAARNQAWDGLITSALAQHLINLDKITDFMLAFSNYTAQLESVIQSTRKPAFTLEFANVRRDNQAATDQIRIIASLSSKDRSVLFTANFATEFYGRRPNPAVGSLRDTQVAGQIDLRLSKSTFEPILTGAGYFQYMHDPALIQIAPGTLAPGTSIELPSDAVALLAPKGNIGIGQVKLTIKVGKAGITVPIAVTFANRTELIKAIDIRGHVGLSFDLDSILAQLK